MTLFIQFDLFLLVVNFADLPLGRGQPPGSRDNSQETRRTGALVN